jgi:hypothetical protein
VCGDLRRFKASLNPKRIYIYTDSVPIGTMYGMYANIWGILMVNVNIYSIHGSYGVYKPHMGPNAGIDGTCSLSGRAWICQRALDECHTPHIKHPREIKGKIHECAGRDL